MSNSDFLLFSYFMYVITLLCISFIGIRTSRKDKQKIKQLQEEYESLIETVKALTHENNILKNQSADTK